MLRFVIVVLTLVAAGRAAFANPSYNGTFVVVDPYNSSDMHFLKCASETVPDASCSNLSASKSGFENPFTNGEASGIFLRLPWCGFQVGADVGQKSLKSAGECHYQLQGSSGAGTYVAGSFTSGGKLQFRGEASVDPAINNLSTCKNVVYDICSTSVLGAALSYIDMINTKAGNQLGLSFVVEAGQYTPQSILDAAGSGHVGFIDLPKVATKHAQTYCTRQPLPWQPKYLEYYTNTIAQLAKYIQRPGFNTPPIVILKQGAITSNSSEFDVAATTAVSDYQTATDPSLRRSEGGSGDGTGPQGDPALQCPDQTADVTGVGALLAKYESDGIAGETMANAYETAFGYVIGYEAGLLAQDGVTNAILSVSTKGSQNFAHVACGTDGNSTCIADPHPGHAQFSWSEYYFTKFINDLFISDSKAFASARSGFVAACSGATCSPASYALTPWQLAVVYTALDPVDSSVNYTAVPSCWLNNTNTRSRYTDPATLLLYTTPAPHPMSTSVVVLGPAPATGAPAGGTMLGWQTKPSSGGACANGTYSLHGAVRNGGQFVEIETDAATEPSCETPLRQGLQHMQQPNANYSCEYE